MIEFIFAIAVIQEVPKVPTWTEDIQGIILSNCMPCHDMGGAGAFHLLTYEDVAG